jgi:hypothetical protein
MPGHEKELLLTEDDAQNVKQAMARARKLADFRPRTSLRIALSEAGEETTLISGWALARLIGWAFYDQQPKKEIDEGKSKANADVDLKKTNREVEQLQRKPTIRPFRPKYAYKAGQLFLLHHLTRDSHDTPSYFRKLTVEEALLAFCMFLQAGKKRKSFGLGGRTLSFLHNDVQKHQELRIIYQVMDFLVRATLACRSDLCKSVIARYFAEKVEPPTEHLGKGAIEKIWDRYRTAAPYIYAFYPRLYPMAGQQGAELKTPIKTDPDWGHLIAQLAEKSTVEECLGHAGFAADVLKKTKMRDVRTRDFENIPHIAPLLRPFDANDEKIIQRYFEEKNYFIK